jgi:hypothetical protein
MKKIIAFAMVAAAFACIAIQTADARGRTGSTRVGGYNSHGKGSHYVGGH